MPCTFDEVEYPNSRAPGRVATIGPDDRTRPGDSPLRSRATAGLASARIPARRAASRKKRRKSTTIERKPVMTDTAPVLAVEDLLACGKKVCALARPTSGSSSLEEAPASSLGLAREAS